MRTPPLAQVLLLLFYTYQAQCYVSQSSSITKPPLGRSFQRKPSTTCVASAVDPDAISIVDVFLSQKTTLADLALAGSLAFGTVPLAGVAFNATRGHADKLVDESRPAEFRTSLLFGIADSVSQAAKIFGILCLADIISGSVDPQLLPSRGNLRESADKVALTVWAALTCRTAKRAYIARAASKDPENLGRLTLFDRLGDFTIAIVAIMFSLDELSIDVGPGLQSMFTAGGIGALIFSLASKDLAEQIVGGLVISAWDVFDEGDSVKLGDGTEGTVQKISLVETEIRGSDNVVVKIPNSQLFNQKVSNLSKVKQSQVKQILRFKYSDLKKLPAILKDIKEEISDSCPKLVTDGSRPFRADLYNYNEDHVEVVVNCHFNIKPGDNEYLDTRQQVLHAIAHAVESNGAEFALPSIHYKSDGPGFGNSL